MTQEKEMPPKLEFGAVFNQLPPKLALGAGIIAGVSDALEEKIQKLASTEFLAGITVLGLSFAAIAIAVLTLVAVWFDDDYQQVIQKYENGWQNAMRPFYVVACVSLLTTLASVVSLLFYPISPTLLQAAMLAFSGALAIWALVGTVQLVGIILRHGKYRSDLIREKREAAARS